MEQVTTIFVLVYTPDLDRYKDRISAFNYRHSDRLIEWAIDTPNIMGHYTMLKLFSNDPYNFYCFALTVADIVKF